MLMVGPIASTSQCDKLAILAPSLSLHVRGNTLRAIAMRQFVHIFYLFKKNTFVVTDL